MSVVVSDTSPLHYLILCGAETILPRLFRQVVIPPTVFRELHQLNRLYAALYGRDDFARRTAIDPGARPRAGKTFQRIR